MCITAQAQTFTGPTGGTATGLSASFTYTPPAGGFGAATTVTLTDAGRGGKFLVGSSSRNYLTFTSSSTAPQTFKYTPPRAMQYLTTPQPLVITATDNVLGKALLWAYVLNMETPPSGWSYALRLNVTNPDSAVALTTLHTTGMDFRPSATVSPSMILPALHYQASHPYDGSNPLPAHLPLGYPVDLAIFDLRSGTATQIDCEVVDANPKNVRVKWRLQASIAALATDSNYELVWGKSSATAMANLLSVYWYANNFMSTTGITGYGKGVSGSGATYGYAGAGTNVTGDGSMVKIDEPATTGANGFLTTSDIPNTTASSFNAMEVTLDVATDIQNPLNALVDSYYATTGTSLTNYYIFGFTWLSQPNYAKFASSGSSGGGYTKSPTLLPPTPGAWYTIDFRNLSATSGQAGKIYKSGNPPPFLWGTNSTTYTAKNSTKAGFFINSSNNMGQEYYVKSMRVFQAVATPASVTTNVVPFFPHHLRQAGMATTFTPFYANVFDALTDPDLPSNQPGASPVVNDAATDNLAVIQSDLNFISATPGKGVLHLRGGDAATTGYKILTAVDNNTFLVPPANTIMEGDGSALDLNCPAYSNGFGVALLPPTQILYGATAVDGFLSGTIQPTTSFKWLANNADSGLVNIRFVSQYPLTTRANYTNITFNSGVAPNHLMVKGNTFITNQSGGLTFTVANSAINHEDAENNVFDMSGSNTATAMSFDANEATFAFNTLTLWSGKLVFGGHHGGLAEYESNEFFRVGGVHNPYNESDGLDLSFSSNTKVMNNVFAELGRYDNTHNDNAPVLFQIGGSGYYGYVGTVASVSGNTFTAQGTPGWTGTTFTYGYSLVVITTGAAKGQWSYIAPLGNAAATGATTLTLVGWNPATVGGVVQPVSAGDTFAISTAEAENFEIGHNTFINQFGGIGLQSGAYNGYIHDNSLINSGSISIAGKGQGPGFQSYPPNHWPMVGVRVEGNYIVQTDGLDSPHIQITGAELDSSLHGTLLLNNDVKGNYVGPIVPGNLEYQGDAYEGVLIGKSPGSGGVDPTSVLDDLLFPQNFPGINNLSAPFNNAAQSARPLVPFLGSGQTTRNR